MKGLSDGDYSDLEWPEQTAASDTSTFSQEVRSPRAAHVAPSNQPQGAFAESVDHLTAHLHPTKLMKWEQGLYTITDQPEQFDIELIHHFLSTESYWAKDIPKAIVVRSIEHALCFGLFREQQQIGFGRVITDRATFAYLSDVFVLPPHRGKGLGKWLVECMLSHPDLQGLRRWMLATGDAHGLYQQFGFALSEPGMLMQKVDTEAYHLVADAHPANDTLECDY